MWGYQPHFRISAQVAAESLFNKLDEALSPEVFLVGVLHEERRDRSPLCVEPEDCGFNPSLFSEAAEQAAHIVAVDDERYVMHSHAVAQDLHERRLRMRALRDALEGTVNRRARYDGKIAFCS